jgi:hypothetical protein
MNPFEMVAMLGTMAIIGTVVVKIVNAVANRSRNALPSDQVKRLEDRLTRIEQGIDAVSIEVERISEGQRFTTKLLSDRSRDAS